MKKITLAFAAATMTLTGVAATPALADPPPWAPAYGKRAKDRAYDERGRYVEPQRIDYDDHVWRGRDGRYYCRRSNGTTGLIIGAGLGALAGHQIAGRGDKTLGAILGGAAGGLLGREIERGTLRCR